MGSLSLRVEEPDAFLNWTEPHRLTNADDTPDISYCVEIINASASGVPTLDGQCGLMEANFSFTIPSLSWCYLYMALVTPINMAGPGVQGAVSYFGTDTSNVKCKSIFVNKCSFQTSFTDLEV